MQRTSLLRTAVKSATLNLPAPQKGPTEMERLPRFETKRQEIKKFFSRQPIEMQCFRKQVKGSVWWNRCTELRRVLCLYARWIGFHNNTQSQPLSRNDAVIPHSPEEWSWGQEGTKKRIRGMGSS